MTQRMAPDWFSINHYQFIKEMTVHDWFMQLKTRRESKALFDLIKNEANLFVRPFSSDEYWQNFQTRLSEIKNSQRKSTQDGYVYSNKPKYIDYYVNYRVIPLFDLTHWYEINNQPLPTNEEFARWVFADVEKITRYQMNDAKKVVKRAMMECDALKWWQNK